MNTRYISLPAINKRISISAYVAAVKMAKANQTREFKTGLTTWWPTSGAEIVRQFHTGMHDRINQTIPAIDRGMAKS